MYKVLILIILVLGMSLSNGYSQGKGKGGGKATAPGQLKKLQHPIPKGIVGTQVQQTGNLIVVPCNGCNQWNQQFKLNTSTGSVVVNVTDQAVYNSLSQSVKPGVSLSVKIGGVTVEGKGLFPSLFEY